MDKELISNAIEKIKADSRDQVNITRHIVEYLDLKDGRHTIESVDNDTDWMNLHQLAESIQAIDTLRQRFGYMPDELNSLLYTLYRQATAMLSPEELAQFKTVL